MFEHYTSVDNPHKTINKCIIPSESKGNAGSDTIINPKHNYLSNSIINEIKESKIHPTSIYNNESTTKANKGKHSKSRYQNNLISFV